MLTQKLYCACAVFLSVLIAEPMNAQVMGAPASTGVNQQLRALFSSVSPPSPQPPVFYDHSAHYADKSWWQPIQTDTSNTALWNVMYDELYTSHYDTTQFLRIDTVVQRGMHFGSDTSVIGLFYYRFAHLKDSALYDTLYFNVDTLGPTLIDNPNATASAYLMDTVFNVCALRDVSSFGTLTYRVDPDFIFVDPDLALDADAGGRILQLDFADGNGWITVSATAVSHHTISYAVSGEKIIQARIIDGSTGQAEAQGSSRVVTPQTNTGTPPDSIWTNIPGITVGVYGDCEIDVGEGAPKFILLLEGFDYNNSSGPADLYGQYVRNTGLEFLRNYGYTFLIVNWNQGTGDMVQNAMRIVNLVDHLKCTYLDTVFNDLPQHQFVMMGASMGGVIARYALTYMEANPGFSNCYPDNMHNTRLYISMDSPHQGAYVPLAFQQLSKDAEFQLSSFLPYNILNTLIEQDDILNSPAARQLLNVHAYSSIAPSANFGPMQERIDFMDDLEALNPSTGGYPEHVKMMAISNGLLTGEHQLGIRNSCIMSPGDHFLQGEGNLNMTILGAPYVGLHVELDLQSVNPGQQFFHLSTGINTWSIQLNWTWKTKCLPPWNWPCVTYPSPAGFSVGFVSTSTISQNRAATGFPAYAVMPGGRQENDDGLLEFIDTNDLAHNWGLTWIDPTGLRLEIDWTGGAGGTSCTNEQVLASSFGAVVAGLDVDLYSQGLNFCFIPIQSALDYTGGVPQDHDLFNEDINVKMANTPFDVIVGEVNGLPGYPQVQSSPNMQLNRGGDWLFPSYNLEHVTLRNHQLTDSLMENWTLQTPPPAGGATVARWALAHYINREIGDEELFLDNFNLDHPAAFQAEYTLTAGERTNPYYEYPGQPVQPQFVFENYSNSPISNPFGYNLNSNGIFARDEPFTVEANGNAILQAETTINTAGTVVQGFLSVEFLPLWVCTLNTFKNGEEPYEFAADQIDRKRGLYPNPVAAGQSIALTNLTKGNCEFQLLSLEGRLLESRELEVEEEKQVTISVQPSLPPGIYLLSVIQNGAVETYKLVVQ